MFTTIAAAITSGLMMMGMFSIVGGVVVPTLTATILGYLGAALIYGGIALSIVAATKKSTDYGSTSPTYSSGIIQTQTNQDLPIPLLYGTTKLAGNRIWQDDNKSNIIKRIVAFAEGEITDFTDIRLNDIPINEISGITINKYYGTSEQIIDSIVGKSNQSERAEIVGSLKNVAYLAISVPRSNNVDVNYNLTSVIKGRKIRVYSSRKKYDIKYSENPAWVMLDFLISYNGLAIALNNNGTINDTTIENLFDISSFLESAAFCDELISYTDKDGNSKSSPRFTFNMIFDSQTSARSLIDEIYRSCRGGLFTKNGKLQFKIDKAQTVSKVFTKDDIVKGSEVFQTLSSEEHYDILKCIYISPDHEWQKVEAFAEIPTYRDGVPIEHSVSIYSVTNFQQASRLAWYYVNSKILCPNFGSFQTDYRACDLEVGDVIKYDSLLMGLNDYIVKITSVVDDGAGTFTINWRTYDERLYSDEIGSKEPHILISDLSDVYGYPSDVAAFSVTQNQKLVEFTWTAVPDINITYEIRKGDSWLSSAIVATNLSNTFYTDNLNQKGVLKYWIKAKTKYNYSKNAAVDILNVQYIPSLNEVISNDILENSRGVFTDTYIYQNKLKLNTIDIWKDLSPEKWQNNGARYYADLLGNWGMKCKSSGEYVSQVFDIGAILSNIVSFNYNFYTSNEQQTFKIEWRYSYDDVNWSDWILANTGAFQFRYYQVKITFYNPCENVMYLSDFIVSVDVPDRSESYTNKEITDADSGVTINYSEDLESKQANSFIKKEPHVLVTPLSNNCYPKVEPYPVSNSKSCTVKLYTNDGTLTKGFVNIQVKGY